ncbi:hypothetical protein CR513_61673, partial [Mucuna pruriens]
RHIMIPFFLVECGDLALNIKINHQIYLGEAHIHDCFLDKHTFKIVWDFLKRKFRDNVKKSLLNSLRREFEVFEIYEAEININYFVRVMALTNKMMRNGEDMLDLKDQCPLISFKALFMSKSLEESTEIVSRHSRMKVVEDEGEEHMVVEDMEKEDNPS